jgi:mannonate dehydratase
VPLLTRRNLLYAGAAGLLGLAAVRFGLPRWMRSRESAALGPEAREFVRRCFDGIDRSRVWDTHVHLIGLGAGGTGCSVHPEMLSHLHPIKRFQFELYKSGTGITNEATADADYLERLLRFQRAANPRGKLLLLAFDFHVDERGNERPELSPIHTPNEYVLSVARAHAELLPGGSVHPYRRDAVDRLDAIAGQGVRAIKWLPNAMGIDPASPLCDAFYRRMAELRLPLITHAGKEYAVDSAPHQDLGNPLRLRRALDAGVRVVVAHCAALGSFPDLDQPESSRATAPAFDLFLRLFADDRWADNLFADISTLAHAHHDPRTVREMLAASHWHRRLVYGSDYPLPAMRFLLSPRRLQVAGLLPGDAARLCAELFEYNPLLFDFAVHRSLQLEKDGRIHRFASGVFETDWLFDVSPPTTAATASA